MGVYILSSKKQYAFTADFILKAFTVRSFT